MENEEKSALGEELDTDEGTDLKNPKQESEPDDERKDIENQLEDETEEGENDTESIAERKTKGTIRIDGEDEDKIDEVEIETTFESLDTSPVESEIFDQKAFKRKQEKEELFLLEFVVDKIVINTEKIPETYVHNIPHPPPIRVTVSFLDFPPLELAQRDFWKYSQFTNAIELELPLKNGRSILFPMVPDDLEEIMQDKTKCNLLVCVYRKFKNFGVRLVGLAQVCIADFVLTVLSFSEKNITNMSSSDRMKKNITLFNDENSMVGIINIFIRFTCFGKRIYTQFQVFEESLSFLFKHRKDEEAYKCRYYHKDLSVTEYYNKWENLKQYMEPISKVPEILIPEELRSEAGEIRRATIEWYEELKDLETKLFLTEEEYEMKKAEELARKLEQERLEEEARLAEERKRQEEEEMEAEDMAEPEVEEAEPEEVEEEEEAEEETMALFEDFDEIPDETEESEMGSIKADDQTKEPPDNKEDTATDQGTGDEAEPTNEET